MPVANERRFKTRHSPIVCFGRTAAAHLPARLRGAGFDLRILAQKKSGDAVLLSGQDESPAGDEIEHLRIARDFHDHCTETSAGQGVDTGTQGVGCIGRAQYEKLRRIDSQLRKTGRGKRAVFERTKILADPKQMLGATYALCGASGKARCASVTGENLMQRTTAKPAAQDRIRIRMAERTASAAFVAAQYGVEELTDSRQAFGCIRHHVHVLFQYEKDCGPESIRSLSDCFYGLLAVPR